MRKQWKGLLAVGLAAAMMVTSLPALQLTKVNAAGVDPINVSGSTTATVKVPDAPLDFTDLSAEEITKACGLGWNLGNTLDAWSWISGTKNDYGEMLPPPRRSLRQFMIWDFLLFVFR